MDYRPLWAMIVIFGGGALFGIVRHVFWSRRYILWRHGEKTYILIEPTWNTPWFQETFGVWYLQEIQKRTIGYKRCGEPFAVKSGGKKVYDTTGIKRIGHGFVF
jgi:hypothetical protein